MQTDNEPRPMNRDRFTVSVCPGVDLTVQSQEASEYLAMRAAQLSALNHLLTSSDFEAWEAKIKSDAIWLAASLAHEVSQLAKSVTIGENLE